MKDKTFAQIKTRIIFISTLIIIFAVLAVLILNNKLSGIESAVYLALSSFINPNLTKFMIFVSDFGSAIGVIGVALVLLILPQTRKNIGIPACVTVAISAGLNWVLKHIFARERPNILRLVSETSFSFPSGHAMNNMALYAIIALAILRHVKSGKIRFAIIAICTIIPLVIGISRVYLGVHFAGDVLCGWLLGLVVALAVYTVIN